MMAIKPENVHVEKFPHDLNLAERAIRHGTFGKDPSIESSIE